MFNGGLRLRKLHLAHCNGNHYNAISVTTEVEATPQPVKSSVPDHNKEESSSSSSAASRRMAAGVRRPSSNKSTSPTTLDPATTSIIEQFRLDNGITPEDDRVASAERPTPQTKEPTKEKSKEKPMEDIVKIFIFLERERELSPAFI